MTTKRIFLTLFMGVCALSLSAKKPTTKVDQSLEIINDVMRTLDVSYTDTLDYDKMTTVALNEMLRQVDPYTIYVPKEKNDDFKRMLTGKYAGVGSTIMQRGDWVYISDPFYGLPAQRAGLRAGDKILSVDGKDCKGKATADVSNMLRGKANTELTVKIEREGEKKPLSFTFKREEIKTPEVDFAGLVTPKTAYISYTDFHEQSSMLIRQKLDSLVALGADRLILDLRDNGGGLISEAVKIVSFFVPKGTEVTCTKGKVESNSRSYKTSTHPIYPDMPLVILVNENSASASEITCGSLQDLKRATLVGEKTFGKGLVQNVRPIKYDGQMKVTIARYYLPSGRCIQGTGIEPNIKVEDSTKINITYELYTKNMFFDYANEYARKHPTLTRPSTMVDVPIQFGDSLLSDFESFLQSQDFSYETETSKYFERVLDFAKQEDLDSTTMAELKNLKVRLETTYHDALWKHRDDVLNLLTAEIVSRYYYQEGKACIRLKDDEVLRRAIEEIEK